MKIDELQIKTGEYIGHLCVDDKHYYHVTQKELEDIKARHKLLKLPCEVFMNVTNEPEKPKPKKEVRCTVCGEKAKTRIYFLGGKGKSDVKLIYMYCPKGHGKIKSFPVEERRRSEEVTV